MTSKKALDNIKKFLKEIDECTGIPYACDYQEEIKKIKSDLEQLEILKKIIENIHPRLVTVANDMKCIQVGFYYFHCSPDLAGIVEKLEYWEEDKIYYENNNSEQAN